jgi:hypothetical protein
MLMTERGIVVTEMLQLWNAAPETFKQLGMYTGYCTWCGKALYAPRSLSNGYGSTCAITVAGMQKEMQKTVQKGYNVNAESAPEVKRQRTIGLRFPSSC